MHVHGWEAVLANLERNVFSTGWSSMAVMSVLAQLLGKERGSISPPGDVRCVGEPPHGLAHVGEALRAHAQLTDAVLERELAIDAAQLVGQRRHRAAVQVEPPRGIASGGEEEKRAPAGPVRLVRVERHVVAATAASTTSAIGSSSPSSSSASECSSLASQSSGLIGRQSAFTA